MPAQGSDTATSPYPHLPVTTHPRALTPGQHFPSTQLRAFNPKPTQGSSSPRSCSGAEGGSDKKVPHGECGSATPAQVQAQREDPVLQCQFLEALPRVGITRQSSGKRRWR